MLRFGSYACARRSSRAGHGMAGVKTPTDHFQKKVIRAPEQRRPDVQMRRAAWTVDRLDWEAGHLVFIDESGARTNLVRQHGRCLRGRRLVANSLRRGVIGCLAMLEESDATRLCGSSCKRL